MKNIITILGLATTLTLTQTGCVTIQTPKFASVESVMELKMNATLPEVISTLGSKPYNIYYSQKDGYTVYTYKYKVLERKVDPDLINFRGGETTGSEVYNTKEHTLFLLFKEGKLESLITSDGRKDTPVLIMLDNTVYTISKDKEKYTLIPTKLEESSPTTFPLGKKGK